MIKSRVVQIERTMRGEKVPLLTPYPAEGMMKYEISSLVNNPKNEDPDILQPINSL